MALVAAGWRLLIEALQEGETVRCLTRPGRLIGARLQLAPLARDDLQRVGDEGRRG